MRSPKLTAIVAVLLTVCAAFMGFGVPTRAASHSDAPLIKPDPQANITDVYAFVGTKYNNASEKVLNVIVHVRPFSEPGDGVIYDRFADDALYSIHIANPNTGAELLRYNFQFSVVNPLSSPGLKNPSTILSYGLGTEFGPILGADSPRRNYSQFYNVTKVAPTGTTSIGSGLLTAPPNVGQRTTPAYNDAAGFAVSGATTFAGLDTYTRETVIGLPSGEAVFAGPREDGFYADTPGIFDLLDPRILDNDGNPNDGLGQDGGGVDGFKGYNVLGFAIQIPIASLPEFVYTAPFANLAAPLPALGVSHGVGVYASVSRPRITLRRTDGDPLPSGPWIQVNRMGNPLFNEVLVALRDKDNYNRRTPTDDAAFATYARNPELAVLINTVFGTSFATANREDLVAVFIPDVLRVSTATGPVRLAGQAGFSRLGFLGGDTTNGVSGGWPNGRRLGDDVVDIALTAVASGPTYAAITVVGDNINANDQVTDAALTADLDTALSKAIATTAGSLRTNIATTTTAIARYKRRKDAIVVFMRLNEEEGWID
jgi:hypothetical protein